VDPAETRAPFVPSPTDEYYAYIRCYGTHGLVCASPIPYRLAFRPAAPTRKYHLLAPKFRPFFSEFTELRRLWQSRPTVFASEQQGGVTPLPNSLSGSKSGLSRGIGEGGAAPPSDPRYHAGRGTCPHGGAPGSARTFPHDHSSCLNRWCTHVIIVVYAYNRSSSNTYIHINDQ
jgi:hypothetical protein